MANVNSVEYAKTITNPPTMLDPQVDHGKVRIAYASFETGASNNGAVASGDTITLFKIPSGAHVVGGYLHMDDNASSTTAVVGDSGDADGWCTSTAVASGPTYTNLADVGGAYWLGTNPLTSEMTVILTAGGANYADDVTVRCVMYYVMD